MGGFQKSAARLSAESLDDQAWVLSMLEANERNQLMVALHDLHAPGLDSENSTDMPSSIQSLPGLDANSPADGEFDCLSRVDSNSMRLFLNDQPDWVCAILVGDARWPWVGDYLAGLDANKLLHLETLVRRVNTSVKPRVSVAVTEAANEQLSANNHQMPSLSAFDVLLARLRQNESTANLTGSPT